MSIAKKIVLALPLIWSTHVALADSQAKAVMKLTQDSQVIGTVSASNSKYGLLLNPALSHLPPGTHGFHLHLGGSCEQQGMAAKGHFDPQKTGSHRGPYQSGHLGDLPVLIVNAKGEASLPLLAPRLTVKQVIGRSLMIHAGSDNYSDEPLKLGGGGARLACGVFKQG